MSAVKELKREAVAYRIAPHLLRRVRIEAAERRVRAANIVAELIAARFDLPLEEVEEDDAGQN
jgi:hypothetical protein